MADVSLYPFTVALGQLDPTNGQRLDMQAFGAPAAVPIGLSAVTPASGGAIGVNAVWSARITLPSAVLSGDGGFDQIARIIIWVQYQNLTSTELVFAGLTQAGFTPDFNGASSITKVSPGVYDVSIIRNGGWPAAPRIYVHANSTVGGQT